MIVAIANVLYCKIVTLIHDYLPNVTSPKLLNVSCRYYNTSALMKINVFDKLCLILGVSLLKTLVTKTTLCITVFVTVR